MDLQQFSVVRAGIVNMNVPTWTISGKFTDSKTGATIKDFTGANIVSFPQALGQLTPEQQDDLVNKIVFDLLRQRFGV